jgi:hypothetical protein
VDEDSGVPAFKNSYWQDDYAAFSLIHDGVYIVSGYVENPKAHHQKKIFQDEMREIFKKTGTQFDEMPTTG